MHRATVIIDSREQKALPFPDHISVRLRRSHKPTLFKIVCKVDKMPEGDYTLAGFEDVILIETKRSAREVADNLLTSDYRRASAAFDRFAARTKYPLLVCEFGVAELFQEDAARATAGHPGLLDAFCSEVARLGVSALFAGPRANLEARRRVAEMVLRMMIARVEMSYPNLHRPKEEESK